MQDRKNILSLIMPSFCLAILSIALSPPQAVAQPPAPMSEAQQMLLAAAKVNGLLGNDVKPWHLKATWQLFDSDGKLKDEGTYEELWAGPTQFKRTFTGKAFSQTDFGTPSGTLRSGQQLPLSLWLILLRQEFVAPLPPTNLVAKTSFKLSPVNSNGIKLNCVKGEKLSTGMMYCIDPSNSISAINAFPESGVKSIHGRIMSFQGRFVAGDLDFILGEKKVMVGHLDFVRSLQPAEMSGLSPTPDATPVQEVVELATVETPVEIVHREYPIYPATAKADRVSGVVVLDVIFGGDGRVKKMEVMSGPAQLQQAALDAVKTWSYKPLILNGKPCEFRNMINVVFSLGSPNAGFRP